MKKASLPIYYQIHENQFKIFCLKKKKQKNRKRKDYTSEIKIII